MANIEFDDEFPEIGRLIGFGQSEIWSDAERRGEDCIALALAENGCRFHVFAGDKVILRKADRVEATLRHEEAELLQADLESAVLLGRNGGGEPVFAVPSPLAEPAITPPYVLSDMRSLLYSAAQDSETSALARAASLLHWHAMNRFCGRCGARTQIRLGGYRIDCPDCSNSIFPRTDPVVIMLSLRGDYCLLGRSPRFPQGWFSTLAGFVEPGETIEAAVRRETMEESSIVLRRVRYHASQPWPFPHSLMIGAYGEAVSEEIRFDPSELEDCRWFSRDEVRKMIAGTHELGFRCPPSKAIAHALIRKWALD